MNKRMTDHANKKRIAYIDLAKGICIFLVVMGHSGFPISIPGWSIVRMPLYFMLSGLFFKNYGGWIQFVKKKTNVILIPFFFFYLTGYIIYYLLKWLYPSLLITDANGIWDLFNNRQFFNGPIWFLLTLYWCNIIFCGISLYVNNDINKLLIIFLLGFIGWYLGNKNIFVPLFIDVAMSCMPFFTIGYFLKKTPILYPNKYDKFNLLFFLIMWAISYVIESSMYQRCSLHYNGIEGWSTYLLAFTSVMSVIFLCKVFNYIPFISYIGRYSIVLLCIHHMIYRPLTLLMAYFQKYSLNGFTVAFLTLILSALCIPLFKKYIPWFVAQKGLIQVKE